MDSLRWQSDQFNAAMNGLEEHLGDDAQAVEDVREELEEAARRLHDGSVEPICGYHDACTHMIAVGLASKIRNIVREMARTEFGMHFYQPSDPETGEPGHQVNFDLYAIPRFDEVPVRLAGMDVFYDALRFLDGQSLDAMEGRLREESAQARSDRRKATHSFDAIHREVADAMQQMVSSLQDEMGKKLALLTNSRSGDSGGDGGGDSKKQPDETKRKTLSPSRQKAYRAYRFAESHHTNKATLRDLHEWLKDPLLPDESIPHEIRDYEPPDKYETFKSYVDQAKQYYRNHPELAGSTALGHSVVHQSQVEPPDRDGQNRPIENLESRCDRAAQIAHEIFDARTDQDKERKWAEVSQLLGQMGISDTTLQTLRRKNDFRGLLELILNTRRAGA
jgi:hypothetical protein